MLILGELTRIFNTGDVAQRHVGVLGGTPSALGTVLFWTTLVDHAHADGQLLAQARSPVGGYNLDRRVETTLAISYEEVAVLVYFAGDPALVAAHVSPTTAMTLAEALLLRKAVRTPQYPPTQHLQERTMRMTTTDPAKWEHRKLNIALLKPHPAQHNFYAHTTTPAEDAALQRDLQDNGQRDSIHVMPPKNKANLPAYTVLDGARRAAGLTAIGKTEANVVIRHDLADADAVTVEAVFLGFNVGRRQLHSIDKARAVLRMYVIEKGRPRGKLYRSDEGEARDRIGKAIGMSGRNLQRYFRLLLTPVEVQRAVRDGKLALVLGERTSWLAEDQQAEIAMRIAAGEDPKAVVAEYIEISNGRHKKASAAFRSCKKHLEAALADLEGRIGQIYRKEIHDSLPLFAKVSDLLSGLRREAKKPYVDTAALAELFKDMAPQSNDKGQ